jgi:hypothetical protein
MAVDPSIASLGLAFSKFDGGIIDARFLRQTTGRQVDYHVRAFAMAQMLRAIAFEASTDLKADLTFVLEVPANWFTGRAMKSKDNEAVQKLYWTCGIIIGVLTQTPCIDSTWVVTPRWKGQVPKDIMKRRALAHVRGSFQGSVDEGMPHDTAEAVLLARYAAERRNVSVENRVWFGDPIVGVHRKNYLDQRCTTSVEMYAWTS